MKETRTDQVERAPRAPRVLLVGGSSVRRATVAMGVRLGGHPFVEVTTPLEAIMRLQDDDSRIGTVVVAGHMGSVTGEEFTSFLVDTFPEVRLSLPSIDELGIAAVRITHPLTGHHHGCAGATGV